MVLHLFPNKGPKKCSDKDQEEGVEFIGGYKVFQEEPNHFTKVLGEKVVIYKLIYDCNSREMLVKYFSDSFIRKIWDFSMSIS